MDPDECWSRSICLHEIQRSDDEGRLLQTGSTSMGQHLVWNGLRVASHRLLDRSAFDQENVPE